MAVDGLVVKKADLGSVDSLGEGGTAKVYRVAGQPTTEPYALVYKEYKPKITKAAGPALLSGLRSIVEHRDRMDGPRQKVLDDRNIWPLRVVVDDDGRSAIGCLMRLIPDEYFQELHVPSGAVKMKPREVQFLMMEEQDARRAGVTVLNSHDRIAICGQIARSLGFLHRAEVVFGDVSSRNAVYHMTPGGRPAVVLVDCDSVRIKGTRSPFGAQPHTPRWEPPEALAAKSALDRMHHHSGGTTSQIRQLQNQSMVQSKATDVYKFGLLVVRLLDYGRNRSANRDSKKAAALLAKEIGRSAAQLLAATLAPTPEDRPTMRDWYELITGGASPTPAGDRRAVGARPAGFDGDSNRAPVDAEGRSAAVLAGASPAAPASGRWAWHEGEGWRRVTS